MEEKLMSVNYLNLIMAHLDACKDVCDHFGIVTTLVPYLKMGRVAGFVSKSFRNAEQKDEYDFAFDPFWDDGTDFDELYKGIDDEFMAKDPYPEIDVKVPDDDDEIIRVTKQWTGSMMADAGLCPFTQDAESAGLPPGPTFYCVDRCSGVEDMYARYWKEAERIEKQKEKDLSTTLLICPEFFLDQVETFESFSTTLTQALGALGVEDLLQLVFFHPNWVFRDGDARAGEGQAANYARRSPWPMINLLRTKQVRAAQKGIPTGLVYKQNEKTLTRIGVDKLETMLRLRDWEDIADFKVNRREFDALKIAQDFQETGKLKKEDTSLEHDTTPAVNRVPANQVEQGNLVNVIMQALEKRLGKGGKPILPLTGPETSATAMAGDFLIQELDRVAERNSVVTTSLPNTPPYDPSDPTSAVELARAERLEAARIELEAEMMNDDSNAETDAMFGRSGIAEKAK
jgi:hypothetical protein